MTLRLTPRAAQDRARRHPARLLALLVVASAGLTLAGLAGMATAASSTTLTTASNAALAETIVVDAHGLTVYELSPETVHHLLCTRANGCFRVWEPLTVASAKTKLSAGRGITSKLGTLHRDGFWQVTLGGHPLYRFVGDGSKKGAAGGQGLHSFGGTWHVVVTSAHSAPSVTTPTTTTPPTTPITPTTPTTPYYPPGY